VIRCRCTFNYVMNGKFFFFYLSNKDQRFIVRQSFAKKCIFNLSQIGTITITRASSNYYPRCVIASLFEGLMVQVCLKEIFVIILNEGTPRGHRCTKEE
jgi:hypothetical protein